jgi:hypothetical protein
MRPKRPRNLFRSSVRARSLGKAARPPKVAELACRNPHMVRPGTIQEVQVWHDPDCRRPRGMACTCHPDVRFANEPLAN